MQRPLGSNPNWPEPCHTLRPYFSLGGAGYANREVKPFVAYPSKTRLDSVSVRAAASQHISTQVSRKSIKLRALRFRGRQDLFPISG